MKIISLNIGIKLNNCSSIIEFFHDQDADIVCLQEVSSTPGGTQSKYKKKQYIDEALGEIYPYRFRGPLFSTSSLGTSERDVGGVMEQGNYILSKIPFLNQGHDFYHQSFRHITDRSDRRQNDHGRALTRVTVQTTQGVLFVGTIHGCWTTDKQSTLRTKQQINSILQISAHFENVILLGDFNLLPETEEITMLEKQYQNSGKIHGITSTRPDFDDGLDKGNQIVDYAFVSQNISIGNFEVPNLTISDHYPLILNIDH